MNTTSNSLLPNMCGRCDNRWGGMNTAHCAGCHLTFTGITSFDAHRRGGTCSEPATVGLIQASRNYQCWGFPSDPDRVFPSSEKRGRQAIEAALNSTEAS